MGITSEEGIFGIWEVNFLYQKCTKKILILQSSNLVKKKSAMGENVGYAALDFQYSGDQL